MKIRHVQRLEFEFLGALLCFFIGLFVLILGIVLCVKTGDFVSVMIIIPSAIMLVSVIVMSYYIQCDSIYRHAIKGKRCLGTVKNITSYAKNRTIYYTLEIYYTSESGEEMLMVYKTIEDISKWFKQGDRVPMLVNGDDGFYNEYWVKHMHSFDEREYLGLRKKEEITDMPQEKEEKSMPEKRICPSCGASIEKNDFFCQNCGASVKQAFAFLSCKKS